VAVCERRGVGGAIDGCTEGGLIVMIISADYIQLGSDGDAVLLPQLDATYALSTQRPPQDGPCVRRRLVGDPGMTTV